MMCSRRANVPGNIFGLRHTWIRTPTQSMGLGGEGAVPGQGQGLIENLKMMLSTEVVVNRPGFPGDSVS